LYHASKETQLAHLPRLLTLSTKYHLPLFLHSRHPDAHTDLVRILKEAGWSSGPPGSLDHVQEGRGRSGVAHSFTGTVAEMEELVSGRSVGVLAHGSIAAADG
jgi:TatD DNase family protein